MVDRGSKGHRHPRVRCDHKLPESSHLMPLFNRHSSSLVVALGRELFQKICFCDVTLIRRTDLPPIRRISDESALVVEIDFTWSLGLVQLIRIPGPADLYYPAAYYESALVAEIDFTWSLGFGLVEPASVKARISLMMFEFSSCLFTDSDMNLVSDSSNVCLRSGYEEFMLLRCHFLDGYFCICTGFSRNGTFRVKDLSGGQYLFRNFVFRVSQFVIEHDGSFLSHRLAAPVKEMGKTRSIT
nr:hypothetical protein [Tanacetum cinerariifolium]